MLRANWVPILILKELNKPVITPRVVCLTGWISDKLKPELDVSDVSHHAIDVNYVKMVSIEYSTLW